RGSAVDEVVHRGLDGGGVSSREADGAPWWRPVKRRAHESVEQNYGTTSNPASRKCQSSVNARRSARSRITMNDAASHSESSGSGLRTNSGRGEPSQPPQWRRYVTCALGRAAS